MPMNFAEPGLLLGAVDGHLRGRRRGNRRHPGHGHRLRDGVGDKSLQPVEPDTLVLRMYGAPGEVDAQSAPQYYGLVQQLAARADLPMPRVYVMNNPQPNAFATGRSPDHSAVCASTGLLDMLSYEELSGVLAHELSHIKNRDTLTMTVAATIGSAI